MDQSQTLNRGSLVVYCLRKDCQCKGFIHGFEKSMMCSNCKHSIEFHETKERYD